MKLQRAEIHKLYGSPIHCPYCGTSPLGDPYAGDEVSPCPHTLFVAHSEGWMYLSMACEEQLKSKDYSVDRDGSLIDIVGPGEEKLYMLEEVCDLWDFPDGIMFVQVVGPPSQECSYIAFAALEER